MFSGINKQKAIIILTVFIDVLGLGIVIPVLPYYVESFGVSSFAVTLLFSVFALCSFISSPFLGALSDKIGRRPVLIISIISTALGWLIFASAKSVWVLFLGRIIDGLAAGNFPIAQSYLIDISKNEKERTHNLGFIGAIFGIGFIIGPSIGAALGTISSELPFWFVGILATLNAIGAYFFLPETNKNLQTDKKISYNPFKPIAKAFFDQDLKYRYLVWFLFGFAISIHQSVFTLFLKEKFGFGAAAAGTIMTIAGVVMILNQGFALKKIWLRYFAEADLELWLMVVAALGFFIMGIANLSIVILAVFLIFVSQSVIRIVFSSRSAGIAGDIRRGEVLGIMASVLSFSMIIGPLIGGSVFQSNKSLPFIIAGLTLIVAFAVLKNNYAKKPQVPIKDEDWEKASNVNIN